MVSGRLYSDRRCRVVRPVQMTVAPASPSAAAIPRPAPRVAPATTATRPRSASRFGSHVMLASPQQRLSSVRKVDVVLIPAPDCATKRGRGNCDGMLFKLVQRIREEFEEAPGLRFTLGEAARFW